MSLGGGGGAAAGEAREQEQQQGVGARLSNQRLHRGGRHLGGGRRRRAHPARQLLLHRARCGRAVQPAAQGLCGAAERGAARAGRGGHRAPGRAAAAGVQRVLRGPHRQPASGAVPLRREQGGRAAEGGVGPGLRVGSEEATRAVELHVELSSLSTRGRARGGGYKQLATDGVVGVWAVGVYAANAARAGTGACLAPAPSLGPLLWCLRALLPVGTRTNEPARCTAGRHRRTRNLC
jgi:hypothetical protein